MTEKYDIDKAMSELALAFKEMSKNVDSNMVAEVHLARAAGIYKAMLRAGLKTPDQVVDRFAETMDFLLSASDPNLPPVEVQWRDGNGVITKTTGKKH